ncbi:MAG: copper chaperone PCu(A)C [Comamonadaceae bacterium]|nr:copper chaperone PCu(A)C [Comamonadaceae bacterium]MBN9368783.1 copper chaperone PCu(A)C [Comamonadaceae bacterium]
MKHLIRTLTLAAAMAAAAAAQAQVTVKDAWVRATVAQQKATGAFMRLESTQDTKLVGASSPLTATVEVHEMLMQDNVMKMREVPAVEVPAGKPVDLKPGGYHIMLLNLQQQVKAGDNIPLALVFEDKDGQRSTVSVQAPARALNTPAAAPHDAHGHKH